MSAESNGSGAESDALQPLSNEPSKPSSDGDRDRPSDISSWPAAIRSPIEILREIARRCLADESLDPNLGQWLGLALQGYLTRQYATVEQAFHLQFPRGGIPWWREEANRERDASLRGLAEQFLSDLSPCQQAREIWIRARRYAASAWRFDCEKEEMPTAYTNTPKEHLWRAFKSGALMPLGERQLRNILAH